MCSLNKKHYTSSIGMGFTTTHTLKKYASIAQYKVRCITDTEMAVTPTCSLK